MSRRFVRHMATLLLLLLCVGAGLFTFLFWTLASLIGALMPPGGNAPFVAPLAILILAGGLSALAFVFVTLRRLTQPLGELIEAADRMAEGDYTARVTERAPQGDVRRLTRTFNSMAERLQANQEQRRNQLAEVAHELRTPLTIIQGNLEALVDGLYPADHARLEAMLEETQLLSRLVDDLQTLALVESGSLKLQKEATDLSTFVRETVASFQAQADAAGVKVEVESAQDIPVVDVDPARIRQVLVNVLANAFRYTPRGGSVRVQCAVDASSAGRAEVIVQDNGVGIAPENLSRIFERSYKSPDSRGSGLGLAIAKNLVEAHGGEIGAESEPGQGTTIRFSLPLSH